MTGDRTAKPRPRWRRLLGLAGRLLGYLLLLVVTLMLGALVFLQTDCGRDMVRERVEQQLDALLAGDVEIEAIEDNLLGDFTIRGVVIHEPAGGEAGAGERAQGVPSVSPTIEIERIDVEYDIWSLWSKEVDIERLAVSGVRVRGRLREDGTLNLGQLLAQSDDDDDDDDDDKDDDDGGGGSSWRVTIADLQVTGGFELHGVAEPLHLDELQIVGDVGLVGSAVAASVRAQARWREREATVIASTEVDTSAAVMFEQPSLLVREGRSGQPEAMLATLDIDGVRFLDQGIQASAQLQTTAGALERLAPGSGIVGGLDLVLVAQPKAEELQVTAKGIAGGAGVDLTAEVALEPEVRGRGTLTLKELVPGALLADGERDARFSGALDFDLTGDAIEVLTGSARLTGEGVLGELPISAIESDLRIDRGVVAGTARARAPGAAQVSVTAQDVLLDPELHLGQVTVDATAEALLTASGGLAPLDGQVTARVDLSGPLHALAARGTVTGRDLIAEDARIAGAEMSLDAVLDALAARPTVDGHATVRARGVVSDGEPVGAVVARLQSVPGGRDIDVTAETVSALGPYRLDASARVSLPDLTEVDPVTGIALRWLRLRTHEVRWRGRGGHVAIASDGRVRARGISVTVGDGRVAVDGTMHAWGPRLGDMDAQVRVTGMDLERLAPITEVVGLSGQISGRLKATRRGARIRGDGVLETKDLVLGPDAEPLTASTTVTLGRRLRAQGMVSGPSLGEAGFQLDVGAPADIADVTAWQALDRSAVRTFGVDLDRLDVAGLQRLAGMQPVASGRLDGSLSWAGGTTEGSLRMSQVTAPQLEGLDAPLDGSITLATRGAFLETSIDLDGDRFGQIFGTAQVRLPRRVFDSAAWSRLDQRALGGAEVQLVEMTLDEELARRLQLPQSYQGVVDARVDIAAGASRAHVTVEAHDLLGGPLALPVAAGFTGNLDRASLVTSAHMVLQDARVVGATAQIDAGARALLAGGLEALLQAPLTAQVQSDGVPLERVARTLALTDVHGGQLDLSVKVAGTAAAPTIDGSLDIAGTRVRDTGLGTLAARIKGDRQRLWGQAKALQDDGGLLSVELAAAPDSWQQGRSEMRARRFDLAVLAGLLPDLLAGYGGQLAGSMTVDGATQKVTGTMSIAGATMPVAEGIENLRKGSVALQATGQEVAFDANGRIGDGKVELSGALTLAGLTPERVRAVMETTEVPVLSDDIRSTVTSQTRVTAAAQAGIWRAQVKVASANADIEQLITRSLHSTSLPSDMVFVEDAAGARIATRMQPVVRRPMKNPYLFLDIDIPDSVTLHSKELHSVIGGSLRVGIGEGDPQINGALHGNRGYLILADRRYRIERADIAFDGDTDARVDIRLTHRFSEMSLHIDVVGSIDDPKVTLGSEPSNYTQGQLLAFVLGASPSSVPGSETRDAAESLATSLVSQKVLGYLDGMLPIDEVRIETETETRSASVTLGKWISSKLFLAYKYRLEARADENGNEGSLEYWFRENLVLEGFVGDEGYYDASLVFVRRY